METIELLRLLLNKPKDEIQDALVDLMVADKIDFIEVNKSYVEYIKYNKEDNRSITAEAVTCIIDSLFVAKKKGKLTDLENNIVQRNLYFLNNIYKGFNMEHINKDLKYIGNEEAKKFSWYYEHNNK